MLRKFCDQCEKEMPLSTGYEFRYQTTDGAPTYHVCNWPCLVEHAEGKAKAVEKAPKEAQWMPKPKYVKYLGDGFIVRSTGTAAFVSHHISGETSVG